MLFLLKKVFCWWLLLFTLINPATAQQLINLNSELYIDSDQLIINQASTEASFLGNVKLFYQDLVLSTKEIKIIYTQGQPYQILIPYKVKILRKSDNVTIIANEGNFDLANHKLTLIGDVYVQNQQNIVASQKLVLIIK